eukprot:SAG31_NODE_5774_length_2332_cov_2.833856_2_plen_111_part_00
MEDFWPPRDAPSSSVHRSSLCNKIWIVLFLKAGTFNVSTRHSQFEYVLALSYVAHLERAHVVHMWMFIGHPPSPPVSVRSTPGILDQVGPVHCIVQAEAQIEELLAITRR